ncbi:sensor histidine kinase [Sulfurimonas aquatica]|uniref:histidine kinase n=1 Tax=Sulfurimonas aquatica TaxID=2672570 RepID=A0A975AY92_9BACT|nr:HAMP domain-containing sensor histidine kinase [Sulfurimonas aquatica]QSZ40754.1 sensor histidine kinase [Sulfurimonas aquatica]
MNKITQKSFFSFLALYLTSSFIFLTLAAYWFFTSQVSMEMNNNFYKMNHIADKVSSKIIHAHMSNTPFKLEEFPNASVALLDENYTLLDGKIESPIDPTQDFYNKDGSFTLISKRAVGHLDVAYVIVQSSQCNENIKVLKNRVAYAVIITAIFIIIISVVMSYIFLIPLRDKMKEIEEFVKDTTHELNTPITALMMSTSRLKNKQVYDEKTINNISISTKQLYDIYSSLSFLSFDNSSEKEESIDFCHVVKEDINYLRELLDKKQITVVEDLQECPINITKTKAKMLINNLLSNSIKYSTPKSTIYLYCSENSFSIKDEGIGIAKDKLKDIFKRFVRANSYAGGFGIGLNIVQSIAAEYNYQVKIDSTEGKGTTVTINFNK